VTSEPSSAIVVTSVGPGTYVVEHDGQRHTVYVARSGSKWWAFSNGRVFEGTRDELDSGGGHAPARPSRHVHQPVTSPMPATVLKILVKAGERVLKGATLLVVEAMKMELPLRAPAEGVVTAVNCREGDLVQPDATLVDVEADS
jgi:3-methylcrotonyl-CoA carboxylase alpha subunit